MNTQKSETDYKQDIILRWDDTNCNAKSGQGH